METLLPRPGCPYTVDDYFRLLPKGEKGSLIDGVIFRDGPVSVLEDQLLWFLKCLLRGFASAGPDGKVLGPRFTYVLRRHTCVEPDIAYISPWRLHILKRDRAIGPPDIAVEVISDETRYVDIELKTPVYARAGVHEYWIVDPTSNQAQFFQLQTSGFVAMPLSGEFCFRSSVLPGFWLDTRWLLADPLPDEFECLERVLAGHRSDQSL
jgi:Uma2 family endonuclease